MAHAILVEEGGYTLAIGTMTDGIGDIALVGTKELSQAVAVQVGIGIDMIRSFHEVADAAEELLIG